MTPSMRNGAGSRRRCRVRDDGLVAFEVDITRQTQARFYQIMRAEGKDPTKKKDVGAVIGRLTEVYLVPGKPTYWPIPRAPWSVGKSFEETKSMVFTRIIRRHLARSVLLWG